MPIFHDYKAIFIHNPKTGGGTMTILFGMLENDIPNLFSEQTPDNEIYDLQHLPYKELKQRIEPAIFNSYHKFTFVRNPWDRILSTYFWNNRGYSTFKKYVKYIDRLYKKYSLTKLTTYEHFKTEYCCHILPQYLYIGDDVKVYRFENFTTAIEDIKTQFNIIMDNPTCHATTHKHYSHYYTKSTKRIISKIYHIDITIFDYTF